MEFITVEQFKEQSKEVQKVFLDWWGANLSDFDLIGYIGNSTAYKECFPSLVRNVAIVCFEMGIEIAPLFTEGQLRRFIEDKTNTDTILGISDCKEYVIALIKNDDELYEMIDTKETNLLQAYWKVACMIAKEEVDE